MLATERSPLEIVHALCAQQGKKKSWVAAQAGLTVQGFGKRLRGKRGYAWQPGEREAVAAALGVPVTLIWPEMASHGATT